MQGRPPFPEFAAFIVYLLLVGHQPYGTEERSLYVILKLVLAGYLHQLTF